MAVPDDWEFKNTTDWSDATWSLNTDYFVSAPSSLFLTAPGVNFEYGVAVYNGANHDLPEGRLDFYVHRGPTEQYPYFNVLIGITDLGVIAITPAHASAGPAWKRYRYTWWYAFDYNNTPSTRLRIERFDDPEWTLISETDHDPLPASNCRAGLAAERLPAVGRLCFDDCAIYAGVE